MIHSVISTGIKTRQDGVKYNKIMHSKEDKEKLLSP